ncbi:MAG TPA: DUF4145 domain-containing protein [Terriglobales bacterium]|nr:DUF4145 domain-containing protein [Terriglobales bacterium]
MEIVNFPDHQFNQIGASGICPHCETKSYFQPVATYREQAHPRRMVSAAQCQSCKEYVLVIGSQQPGGTQSPFNLSSVFPIGKPNDRVDESVPAMVKEDFAEALRCQWIRAYKACVVMCGRAIQTSALALGAKGSRLVDQIDDLHKSGKITESLRDFAHEVRLVRNDGAHPDKDGLADVTPEDAMDVIEFTRQYLEHVYIMPAKLKARKGTSSVPIVAVKP